LAHSIAVLRTAHAALKATAPYVAASAIFAPVPVRGRRVPAFRSYSLALAANGLREPVARPITLAQASLRPARTAKRKIRAKGQSERNSFRARIRLRMRSVFAAGSAAGSAIAAKNSAPAAAPASKKTAEKIPARQQKGLLRLFTPSKTAAKSAKDAKTQPRKTRVGRETVKAAKRAAPATALSSPVHLDAETREQPKNAAKPSGRRKKPQIDTPVDKPVSKAGPPSKTDERSAKLLADIPAQMVEKADRTAKVPASLSIEAKKANGGDTRSKPGGPARDASPSDEAEIVTQAIAGISDRPALSEPDVAAQAPGKKTSFLGRLFGAARSSSTVQNDQLTDDLVADLRSFHNEADRATDLDAGIFEEPIGATVSLRDKLSSLERTDDSKLFDQAIGDDDTEQEIAPTPIDDDGAAERQDANDFAPLTQSLMELQSNIQPPAPQIKAFPWLRH
ncbi:MAG: hypothetical protein KTR19_06225, partial [Hyphomicrobiales bacterium]|nr:hypothetical protein [Hyphomicrobiales bacterium]